MLTNNMADKCPSCGSFLDETGECEVCGWAPVDGVPTAKEEKKEDEETKEPDEEEVPESTGLKCPSCGNFLVDEDMCDFCGWIRKAGSDDEVEREKRIVEIMEKYSISRSKAERLYNSLVEEESENGLVPEIVFREEGTEYGPVSIEAYDDEEFLETLEEETEEEEDPETEEEVEPDAELETAEILVGETATEDITEETITAEVIDEQETITAEVEEDDDLSEEVRGKSLMGVVSGRFLGTFLFSVAVALYVLVVSYFLTKDSPGGGTGLLIIASALFVTVGLERVWPLQSMKGQEELRQRALDVMRKRRPTPPKLPKKKRLPKRIGKDGIPEEDNEYPEERKAETKEKKEETTEPEADIQETSEESLDTEGTEDKDESSHSLEEEERVDFACPVCQSIVKPDDEKCPGCGSVFDD